jgi:hypothetical protein
MMIDAKTVRQTISMFDEQKLDIRTVTLGVSLQPCVGARRGGGAPPPPRPRRAGARGPEELAAGLPEELRGRVVPLVEEVNAFADAVYEHIYRTARDLVPVVDRIAQKYGIKIANKRLSVTPVGSLVSQFFTDEEMFGDITSYRDFKGHPTRPLVEEVFVTVARALDDARAACGIDILGGFSALVPKGMTRGEQFLLYSLPAALASTEAVCSSVNVATTRAGINMDAVSTLGEVIQDLAYVTREQNSFGCCKLVVYANMPDDNPYMAGAMHGPGEADAVINVGVSGPGVIYGALNSFIKAAEADDIFYSLGDLADVIKHAAFKVTKVGELVGIEASQEVSAELARRRGRDGEAAEILAGRRRGAIEFGIVDVSLAPTYKEGDSVAQILERLGVTRIGMPGTTAALAMLTDAVKKGGVFASKFVGGMSGAFIPVSEDRHMEAAFSSGALTLEKLEAMTSVCSVGLDMIAIKADACEEGEIDPSVWSGIIADEISVGVFGGKTTAVRIIPVVEPRYKAEDREAPRGGRGSKVVFGVRPQSEWEESGRRYALFDADALENNLWGEAVPVGLNKRYLWETQPDVDGARARTDGQPPACVRSAFSVRGGRIPAPIHSLRN